MCYVVYDSVVFPDVDVSLNIKLNFRCCPPPVARAETHPPYNGNGYLPNHHSNGNGSVLHYSMNQSTGSASGGGGDRDYEMDSFTPLTHHLRENEECDTKVGWSHAVMNVSMNTAVYSDA